MEITSWFGRTLFSLCIGLWSGCRGGVVWCGAAREVASGGAVGPGPEGKGVATGQLCVDIET